MLAANQTATLPLNTLPAIARETYVVPGMNKNLLSIGKICDADCTAIFTKNTVTIHKNDQVLLEGTRNPTHGLWEVPLPHNQCNMTYHSKNTRDMIKFMHAALGSPTVSTLNKAIRNGYLKSWPGLTTKNVNYHINFNDAIMKGHLDRVRKNLRSTSKEISENGIIQETKSHFAFATIQEIDKIYTDQTGAFPVLSSRGYRYIFIMSNHNAARKISNIS